MLTLFDDYPIHQTPATVNTPATSDRDFYERYWFNGYDKSGEVYIGVATALYPHLGIQDCGISIVRNGEQHAFHASCRATPEPTDLTIGPYRLEILDPMKSVRITLEDNETDFACDLTFRGRTANIEEPRHTFWRGNRAHMDTTRFTQFGFWEGWLRYDGQTVEFDGETMYGTKDRSWGRRGVGGRDPRGAPPTEFGGIFFLWAPLHFEDMCAHYQLFEDSRGRPLFQVGAHLPVYESVDALPGVTDPDVVDMRDLHHRLTFASDSRMIEDINLSFAELDTGEVHEIVLEKIFTYRMKGIGYTHPEWGHGMWKGELAMASESWALEDVDDMAPENHHVQHLVWAHMGDRKGIGVLEQAIFGPYRPYGLSGALDPPRA
ncbi:MAG: hypothetical protein AAF480_15730 [Actinomycetota bacterium]